MWNTFYLEKEVCLVIHREHNRSTHSSLYALSAEPVNVWLVFDIIHQLRFTDAY